MGALIKILLLIGLFVFLIWQTFIHLYFLQSNFYMISDYFKNVYPIKNDLFFLNLFAYIIILIFDIYYFAFYYFALILIRIIRSYKLFKKLNFTKRIFRLVIINILIIFLLILILNKLDLEYILIFYILSNIVLSFIIMISYYILYPIEYLIANHYIKIAKLNLDKNSELIKIGITGSYGKTSVKEILNAIIKNNFFTLKTPKSYNTDLGVALTINKMLKPTHEIFIAEMGAKKIGEINRLCNFIKPQMGIITSVGRQHTNTFGDMYNIYKTKKELCDYLNKNFCVFNLMNFYVKKMYDNYQGVKLGIFILLKHKIENIILCKSKKYYYKSTQFKGIYTEFSKSNTVYAKNIFMNENGVNFDLYVNGKFYLNIKSKLLGLHNIINILLASAMSYKLNVNMNDILLGVEKLESIEARYQKFIGKNGALIINNGYNSNLDSAKISMRSLQYFNKKNIIIITPGLIECSDNYKYNYEFGKILARFADMVVIVKNVNKRAIEQGLLDSNFSMDKVSYCVSFADARKIIDSANGDSLILIENDLPDNFK